MTPEQQARKTVDQHLRHAGWNMQDRGDISLFGSARAAVSMREAHLKTGIAAYIAEAYVMKDLLYVQFSNANVSSNEKWP